MKEQRFDIRYSKLTDIETMISKSDWTERFDQFNCQPPSFLIRTTTKIVWAIEPVKNRPNRKKSKINLNF